VFVVRIVAGIERVEGSDCLKYSCFELGRQGVDTNSHHDPAACKGVAEVVVEGSDALRLCEGGNVTHRRPPRLRFCTVTCAAHRSAGSHRRTGLAALCVKFCDPINGEGILLVGRTFATVRVRSRLFVTHAVDDTAARLHLAPVIPILKNLHRWMLELRSTGELRRRFVNRRISKKIAARFVLSELKGMKSGAPHLAPVVPMLAYSHIGIGREAQLVKFTPNFSEATDRQKIEK
jgi:hypothetical protein